MEEEYKYVIDNNGLLAGDDAFTIDKDKHFERKIYLFYDTKVKGLTFPDLTSFSLLNEYIPKEEKFLTRKDLISEVDWDDTINYPNQTIKLEMVDGMVIARTIMISQKQMKEIVDLIKKASNDENIKINL